MYFDNTAADQQDDLLAVVSAWPTDGEYALFDDDPREGGGELDPADCPGYERCPASSVTWAVSDPESPTIRATLSFGTATAPWLSTATHWGFIKADGSARHRLDLPNELDVNAAGPVSTTIDMFHDDEDEDF